MRVRSERPDMAAYGVQDDPDGLLAWSWAEARLASSRNFWVTTANAAGRPHSMPVWGVWMPERHRFGFGCATESRKSRNLSSNPKIVVTGQDTVNVVSIEGVAVRLGVDHARRMGAAWFDKYQNEPGFDDRQAAIDFIVASAAYEVVPERAFGLIETPEEFGRSATRWVWET